MSAETTKTVHEIRLTEFEAADAQGRRVVDANFDLIRDVKVKLTVAVGRC